MLMLGIRIVEKLGLELQDALEIEGANVEKFLGRDLAMLGTKNGSRGSELTKAILNDLELGFILDDIRLVENDLAEAEQYGCMQIGLRCGINSYTYIK